VGRVEGAPLDFCGLGSKRNGLGKGGGKEGKKKRVKLFEKTIKQMNSDTQKQCSGMYATLNSYD
jgi:hypothetical protein